MTVEQLAQKCGFEVLRGGEALNKPVTGGYCGDLLSWAMGRAPSQSAWITVMGNENAVAVAVLADVSCLILTKGASLDEKAAARAKENGIVVLKSGREAFETVAGVAEALKNE